jgi:hypothetical protein
LTGAALPFLLVAVLQRYERSGEPATELGSELGSSATKVPAYAAAEVTTAAILCVSAAYILFNETLANWQALWFCAGLIALTVTILVPVRDAPG